MSWSFSAVGKATAVAKAALAEKETTRCAEPEEGHRKAALDYLAQAAGGIIGDNQFVRAEASGSMWKDGDTVKSHTLSLKFEPIYGVFVE